MGDRRRAAPRSLLGDAVVERRAFLRLLGRRSAGVAALGTGVLGWGVGLGLGACASDDQGSSDGAAPRSAGTTRSTPPPATPNALDPPDFGPMFRPGTRYRFDEDVGGGQAVVEVHEVGLLHLATGRLVAGDPFWVDTQTPAFTVTVPPGDYPVDVSMARTERRRADPGYPGPAPLGAAARLTIRQKRATTWEMALLPGEDIADLGPGEFYGMPVDTGTAALGASRSTLLWTVRPT